MLTTFVPGLRCRRPATEKYPIRAAFLFHENPFATDSRRWICTWKAKRTSDVLQICRPMTGNRSSRPGPLRYSLDLQAKIPRALWVTGSMSLDRGTTNACAASNISYIPMQVDVPDVALQMDLPAHRNRGLDASTFEKIFSSPCLPTRIAIGRVSESVPAVRNHIGKLSGSRNCHDARRRFPAVCSFRLGNPRPVERCRPTSPRPFLAVHRSPKGFVAYGSSQT